MKLNRKILNLFVLACCAVLFTACNEDKKIITGKVAVAGHEPFAYVRVIDQDKVEYKLVGPMRDTLRKEYQGQIVQLEGKVVKKSVGPGMPAEFLVLVIVAR